jgi:hypothetical protein
VRHLTKGQQAMAVAKAYPEAEKGGRGNARKVPLSSSFSRQYLDRARIVLALAPELVDLLLAGFRLRLVGPPPPVAICGHCSDTD